MIVRKELTDFELPSSFGDPTKSQIDQELIDLAKNYLSLNFVLAQLSAACPVCGPIAKFERDLGSRLRADDITDRLADTAWSAASIAAGSFSGIVAKAHILSDWCEDREEDLGSTLAASLCEDILRLDATNT